MTPSLHMDDSLVRGRYDVIGNTHVDVTAS